MKEQRSILVIDPDAGIADTIGRALGALPATRVRTETSTLTGLNGKAVAMASDVDVILVRAQPGNDDEMAALKAVAAARKPGSMLLALADGGIALTDARALTKIGVDEVLPIGADPGDLGAQIAALSRAPAAGGQRQGRIIAVAQARGGVGSTTVAVNLADQLAAERKRFRKEERFPVALVDFDLQFGTVGSFLDLPEQEALMTMALDGTIPDANFLAQSLVTTDKGVSVLAAPSRFAPLDSLRGEQVAAVLDQLRQTHDYVVVDLPRAIVGWIEAVLTRADQIVIVTDASIPAVRHTRRLIDFFTADHMALPVKVVVNHEKRSIFKAGVQREIAKVLERPLDHWLPHDPKAARNAADRGKPLSAVASGAALTKAIQRLAQTTRADLPVIPTTRTK